jgi:hypothetical protein
VMMMWWGEGSSVLLGMLKCDWMVQYGFGGQATLWLH